MDIERFKRERGQAAKRPWRPSQFTRISSIVKAYGLGETFLRTLEAPPESLTGAGRRFKAIKFKTALELPLFALATAEVYDLTTRIIREIDNPYLDYVQDPEEILLCRPLFHCNPHLDPEALNRFHFATLLGRELNR
jgi:hypothetical protein